MVKNILDYPMIVNVISMSSSQKFQVEIDIYEQNEKDMEKSCLQSEINLWNNNNAIYKRKHKYFTWCCMS